MALSEKILTGRKFRQKSGNGWIRYSFWTKSTDIEFTDGKNAEQKVEGINSQITALNHSLALLNQNIKNIRVVSALPSDAASHTDTLYIIK